MWDGSKFPADKSVRFKLENAPKMPEGNLVSLEKFTLNEPPSPSASTPSSEAAPLDTAARDADACRVLVGICGAGKLDQFAVDAKGNLRCLPEVDLDGVKAFCFAIDRSSKRSVSPSDAGSHSILQYSSCIPSLPSFLPPSLTHSLPLIL